MRWESWAVSSDTVSPDKPWLTLCWEWEQSKPRNIQLVRASVGRQRGREREPMLSCWLQAGLNLTDSSSPPLLQSLSHSPASTVNPAGCGSNNHWFTRLTIIPRNYHFRNVYICNSINRDTASAPLVQLQWVVGWNFSMTMTFLRWCSLGGRWSQYPHITPTYAQSHGLMPLIHHICPAL